MGKWLAAVVLLATVYGVAADTASLQIKRTLDARDLSLNWTPKNGGPAGKDNCDKGWIEVNEGKCCPHDHPNLILGDCYAPCDDGHDELTIGTYVGCRAQCEGGEASSINYCDRGPSHRIRTDVPRASIQPKVQNSPQPDTDTYCPKDQVKVARLNGHKGTGHGGCCPASKPHLIASQCFAACDNDRDGIAIGNFVGCRTHCPAGFEKEDHNVCTKSADGELVTVEREDFPREGVAPDDRLKRESPKVPDGCSDAYNAASDSYCCPVARPKLIGLLCYERCAHGYEDVHYGCRRDCPKGWHKSALSCHHKGKTKHRKGYERHPVGAKIRDKSVALPTSTGSL